jgi:hypothetical protein
MIHIKKFNENYTNKESKIVNFYNDYINLLKQSDDEDDEEENYLTDNEKLTEVGQLTLKYNLSKEDVKYILDNYDISLDIDKLLQYTYDNWVDEEDENYLWDEMLHRISGYSFPKDYKKVINILKSKYNITKK